MATNNHQSVAFIFGNQKGEMPIMLAINCRTRSQAVASIADRTATQQTK